MYVYVCVCMRMYVYVAEETNWRVRVHLADALSHAIPLVAVQVSPLPPLYPQARGDSYQGTMRSHAIPLVAVQVLCRMVKQEEDPRAIWGVFRAGGRVKDQLMKKALAERYREHLTTPLPPKALAELMIALGAQGRTLMPNADLKPLTLPSSP